MITQPTIIASAPSRIDFGGGWTDVPPYSHEEGGYVCNVAISLRATAALYPDHNHENATTADAFPAESELAAAALRRAAAWRSDTALPTPALTIRSNFPVGAGLGGSSAAGVAALGALLTYAGGSCTPEQIAELSRAVEVEELGIAGGRQDHYAASFGGALGLRFSASGVAVDRVQLSAEAAASLARRSILVYTGKSRISGKTIEAVLSAYAERNASVCLALERMKALAESMREALAASDLDMLGNLVAEHWEHQRELHPTISTPEIDAIMTAARSAGAIGGKALGASGGGCVVLIAREGAEHDVRTAVAQLGEVLDYSVSQTGLEVRRVD